MKNLKKATLAIAFTITISLAFQCASPKLATTTFETQTPFELNTVTFQEWYAGIKVGGTGINMFVPIKNANQDIAFDEIFFRNLRGKIIKEGKKYKAVLKHPARHYTFKKAEKPANYPFDLKDDECVISYVENGQTKYHKVVSLNEVAGTYYENGPPSIYTRSISSGMASLDEEEDDDN